MDDGAADAIAWLGRIDPNVILTLAVASVVLVKLWPLLSKVVRVVNIILSLEAWMKTVDERLAAAQKLPETVENLAKEQEEQRAEDVRTHARLTRLETAAFGGGGDNG